MPDLSKSVSWNRLCEIREDYRNRGSTFVLTCGCFDLLHAGHVSFLRRAKEHGDGLAVLCNSDASIRQIKGERRPIVIEAERIYLLESLACVDWVIMLHQTTPFEAIRLLKPDVYCKGAEYDGRLPEAEIVSQNGGRTEYLKPQFRISTTQIVERITSRAR